MSRQAPPSAPQAAPAAPVDPGTLEEIARAIAAATGMPVDQVAAQLGRLVAGPQTPADRLLVRLNARYAGARIVPARKRPRKRPRK